MDRMKPAPAPALGILTAAELEHACDRRSDTALRNRVADVLSLVSQAEVEADRCEVCGQRGVGHGCGACKAGRVCGRCWMMAACCDMNGVVRS